MTLHRLHSSLECVGATFLHQEQSFDYQGKIGDKTDLITSNSYVIFTIPPSEMRGSSLPSPTLAGRHCVLKTWARRARNRSKLGLISILLRELQLLAFLRLEGHSERRSISTKLKTDTGRIKHKWAQGHTQNLCCLFRGIKGHHQFSRQAWESETIIWSLREIIAMKLPCKKRSRQIKILCGS